MEKKIIFITGANRGIGKETATGLAKQGHHLVLHGRNKALLQDVSEEIKTATGNNEVDIIMADLYSLADVKRMTDAFKSRYERLDVLINNAGITKDNLIPLMSEEEFDVVISTNLKGTFNCCRHAVKRMIKQKHGRIINISSVVGLAGNSGQVNYAASKAGIIGMTKSMARELGKKNILVNAIAPGFIQTEMTDKIPEAIRMEMVKNIPLQRLGQPADVADAVEFLISDKASYITGQVLSVNGGYYM